MASGTERDGVGSSWRLHVQLKFTRHLETWALVAGALEIMEVLRADGVARMLMVTRDRARGIRDTDPERG